jgi:uncharacterized membrane protein YeaQ/YmgE (transglycosylase-associated protein family)
VAIYRAFSFAERAMGILGAIIIGGIVGFLAKLITPGDPKPRGFILTIVLGIVGGIVATFLGQAIGFYQPGEPAGFFGALIGAIIILLIWRQVARPR